MRMSGSVPLGDVPPGDYIARAVFLTNGNAVGRVMRPVHVARKRRAAPARSASRRRRHEAGRARTCGGPGASHSTPRRPSTSTN